MVLGRGRDLCRFYPLYTVLLAFPPRLNATSRRRVPILLPISYTQDPFVVINSVVLEPGRTHEIP